MSEDAILHADLDAFYASVEQRDDPALRGRPVIVGGGVVLAASYEAKARGVQTAMGGRQALRLCPDAIVVGPRMSAYVEASRAVFDVFENTSPLVEGLSIDEAFLDVGGLRRLRGSPEHIAHNLRRDVRREVGLPISVGVAGTKFLAKVASAVSKPDGLLVVPSGGELDFLYPLPIERLWGVGRVTSARLRSRGVRTVADLAALDEDVLARLVGRGAGRHLHAVSHNRDPRQVEVGHRRGSVGAQHSLGRSEPTADDLDAVLLALVDRVCRRLRKGERTARTVTLRLRFDDYTRATRSHTMPAPTDRTDVVVAAARSLLHLARHIIECSGITLLGVAVSGLANGPPQLELPLERVPPRELDGAVDAVRRRFGTSALNRAVQLGRRDPLEVPLLPD
ncbi:DNA polymerase IV [Solicola gregarius]|uniref:DNA polymerase IV n=1 Tax=Solicola gregarius TaxID=2908642 RepID=A0AA46YNP3_9ACTN|nr:DNA polymerase IV [Solicola gregarius]UYM07691.1 DNA polymerase IV [Solicola gregarius]